ncbi:hypothetical protein U0070_002896, partial [Myodes glareolus]
EEQQGQCLRIVSSVSPAGLYCCYAVIIILSVAVIALSLALLLSGLFDYVMLVCWYLSIVKFIEVTNFLYLVITKAGKTEQTSIKNTYAACPRMRVGFGNRCFYFSEDSGKWTFSENYYMALKAQLAQIDSQEELKVLNRFKGDSTAWIGLHRESSEYPWMWTDNTEYNNLVPIRGEGQHAYLSDRGISSGRNYIRRRWICSKPYSYTLQCPGVSQLV